VPRGGSCSRTALEGGKGFSPYRSLSRTWQLHVTGYLARRFTHALPSHQKVPYQLALKLEAEPRIPCHGASPTKPAQPVQSVGVACPTCAVHSTVGQIKVSKSYGLLRSGQIVLRRIAVLRDMLKPKTHAQPAFCVSARRRILLDVRPLLPWG